MNTTKTIKLTDNGKTIRARDGHNTCIALCNYSGNLGASAARRAVIDQIKAKHNDFDLVEAGEVETLTTHFRDGVAISEAWT